MCEIIKKYTNNNIGDKILEVNVGLFNDIHLKRNRESLEKLFDKEVPRTTNDVVIFFVKVIGKLGGVLQEKTFCRSGFSDSENGLPLTGLPSSPIRIIEPG